MKELKLLRTCDASTNSSSSCNQDTLNFKLLTQNTLENCPQAIHNGKQGILWIEYGEYDQKWDRNQCAKKSMRQEERTKKIP